METIQEIGVRCGTDKIRAHSYGPIYSQFLDPLRNLPINILEIGIHLGESLQLWLDAFPEAQVFGIDTADFTRFRNPRMHTYNCQAHEARVGELFTKDFFDVIIDDASHIPDQQWASYRYLWPSLKKGGYYFVEDIIHPREINKWSLEPAYFGVFGRDVNGRGVEFHQDDILVVLKK